MTTDDHTTDASWKARPWAARLVRVAVVLAPMLAGAGTAAALGHALPGSRTVGHVVARVLAIVALSTVVVMVVDRVARRLLPLAALYRLSLVFPDRAPSRFRSALKAGSSRRVARLVEHTRAHGLPDEPNAAAARVVEMISAIGDHDRRTRGHSERVRLYADLIGQEMHLSKTDRQKLQWGALLHDLGKLMVPPEILNKRGRPTDEEWAVLREHPAHGDRLIAPLRPFLGMWADAVGGHHEWWNGRGYPNKLQGDEISLSAAIVAVADAYEVMTAVRSYKVSMPASHAREELTRSAGVQFSPDVVRAFLCVSLGRLRLTAGPVSSLAQIPFVGTVARVPAAMSTVVQTASGVAASATPGLAASVLAATAVAASTPTLTIPGAQKPVAVHSVPAAQPARATEVTATPAGGSDPTTPTTGSAPQPTPDGSTTTTTPPGGSGNAAGSNAGGNGNGATATPGSGSSANNGSGTGTGGNGQSNANGSTASTGGNGQGNANGSTASTGGNGNSGNGKGATTTVSTTTTTPVTAASTGGSSGTHGKSTTTTVP